MSERPRTRRIAVITNPISGVPVRHALIPRFLDTLKGAGAEVEVHETERAGHATDLARDLSPEHDTIVVIGGDGTINEVANGLEGKGAALATFPTGTSSIFARDFGIPFQPVKAARVVLEGRRRRMDVGRVNDRRFLAVVGVGWDAQVVNEVAARRRGHLGKHRYLGPVLKAAREYRWPALRIHVDDETRPRIRHLAFACNIRNYAAFFRIAPDAVPYDGLLDFVLVGDGCSRNYLRWAIGALMGTLPRCREVDYVKGSRLRIEADEPVPWQIDGDVGGTTPVEIRVEKSALEVIVP